MKTELTLTIAPSKTLTEADIRDIGRFAEADGQTANDFIAGAIQTALDERRRATPATNPQEVPA